LTLSDKQYFFQMFFKEAAVRFHILSLSLLLILSCQPAWADPDLVSPTTDFCLDCHNTSTPQIVADWERSRHARTTLGEALKSPKLESRVSSEHIPKEFLEFSVGCAECHTLNADNHPDTFDHEGELVHTVVSPKDCSICHSVEADQYDKNKMAHAYGNLKNNPLYEDLVRTINGVSHVENGRLVRQEPDALTDETSCYYCHGTKVTVGDLVVRETVQGEFLIPELSGWPNQGVGRINPDGSRGSCTACHTRHQFSLQLARQPYTCSQCHKGPDVPAYKIYEVSKHGNMFSSLKGEWDFDRIPWTAGDDFTAPTCAVCHISLVADRTGEVVVERTHRMNDRLADRLFGLVYAHPQPKNPDTSIIKNKAGLPLPTELNGEPVEKYLIDEAEHKKRTSAMQSVCHACHSRSWVTGHWNLLNNTISTTNRMTLAATELLERAWKENLAQGPATGGSIFDESIEHLWIAQWLFYANSTRLSAAMSGADYGVFAGGRWNLSTNLQAMSEWLDQRTATADQNKD
jgi:hydroxylamine dehydrogenase